MRSPAAVPNRLHGESRAGQMTLIFLFAGLVVLFAALPSPARAVQCAVPDLEAYRAMIQPVVSMEPAHQPGDPRTPPDNPQVGDSWLWYVWRLNGPPQADLRTCTVRGEGEHVYIVVENSQWLTRVNQADVDAMIFAWDQGSVGQWPEKGIYQLNTEHFGPVPDELDNDPKVYVLYYDFDINADGFFWAFDEFPNGSQPYQSNECEVLYMNSSDNDPGGEYLISVQAHEFQHMIHWLADENETTWLNEGMGELAMWLYGHPDAVVSFPSNPDINLTTWTTGFADYVKVYLWSLYFYEHFGGQPAVLYLTSLQSNSIMSVQQALTDLGYTTTFAQLMKDWVTANYLDDPSIEGGRYNYAGEDLPPFAAITKSTYPVPLTNGSVNHWASDYVKFINGQPQRLHFDGGDTSDWSARVIKYLGGVPLSVEDIVLDPVDAGYIDLTSFGFDYDQVVLVGANVSDTGAMTYQYNTSGNPAGVEGEQPLAGRFQLERSGANPFSAGTALRLTLDRDAVIQASVHDVNGRLVRTVASGPMTAGRHDLRWDGRQEDGSGAAGGVYYLRVADSQGRHLSESLVRIP